jgi:ArsR family transcriptional regulator, arsenate/arsenite/antimonite-responsive transcriptional repressor
MRLLSQTFKALSEETRLEILALLFRHEELCVCDVEAILAVTQSKASRHLRYLLATGLVQERRDGLWMRYRIVEQPGPEQRAVLDTARMLLTNPMVADVEARYERWMAKKACCGPGV